MTDTARVEGGNPLMGETWGWMPLPDGWMWWARTRDGVRYQGRAHSETHARLWAFGILDIVDMHCDEDERGSE